jgi:hypothetical protein
MDGGEIMVLYTSNTPTFQAGEERVRKFHPPMQQIFIRNTVNIEAGSKHQH